MLVRNVRGKVAKAFMATLLGSRLEGSIRGNEEKRKKGKEEKGRSGKGEKDRWVPGGKEASEEKWQTHVWQHW